MPAPRASAQKILNSYMQLTADLQARVIQLQAENEELTEENGRLTKRLEKLEPTPQE